MRSAPRISAGELDCAPRGFATGGAAAREGFGNDGYLFGFGHEHAIAPLPNGDLQARDTRTRTKLTRIALKTP